MANELIQRNAFATAIRLQRAPQGAQCGTAAASWSARRKDQIVLKVGAALDC
jgi:hypothetical protein